jgi:hypothetical protein
VEDAIQTAFAHVPETDNMLVIVIASVATTDECSRRGRDLVVALNATMLEEYITPIERPTMTAGDSLS